MLALFLSDYGRDIIKRKYDAFTTDRAYDHRPSGSWGIGWLVDWFVHTQDTHVALRQRLANVEHVLRHAIQEIRKQTQTDVRVVSGPCGLIRDLCNTFVSLTRDGLHPERWLRLHGLDLDYAGDVLPEAARRAETVGMPMTFERADLVDEALSTKLGPGAIDVFLSMGLSVWLDPGGRTRLLDNIRRLLRPGGLLVIDNFRRHKGSRFLEDFEMVAWYPSDEEFEAEISASGFAIEQKRESDNGVNVVYRARSLGLGA